MRPRADPKVYFRRTGNLDNSLYSTNEFRIPHKPCRVRLILSNEFRFLDPWHLPLCLIHHPAFAFYRAFFENPG